jgi:hypothetical protein
MNINIAIRAIAKMEDAALVKAYETNCDNLPYMIGDIRANALQRNALYLAELDRRSS